MDILFLSHRIPYPPDKGDKIRSFHLLRALAGHWRVHLGTFVDDPADWRHVAELQKLCTSSCILPLRKWKATLRSVTGFRTGAPLTLPYYFDARLAHWVKTLASRVELGAVIVFSSSMAQYAARAGLAPRSIVDFVDVDSDKWRQYAQTAGPVRRWIYGREARRLQAEESKIVAVSHLSIVVSPAERELLVGSEGQDGRNRRRIAIVRNGVDVNFWSPTRRYVAPFPCEQLPVVFTGAMDYLANVDAVRWFAKEVLPRVCRHQPAAHFYIVGSNPTAAVRRLASRTTTVTGRVDDTRPYLAHARAIVAPLRLARGTQNKVLEAMAMARTVVATSAAVRGIDPHPPGVRVVDDCAAMAEATIAALEQPAETADGRRARAYVASEFDWTRNLEQLVEAVAGLTGVRESHGASAA